MKMGILSFSAGFHAENNTAPILEKFGAEYVPWHSPEGVDKYDALYLIGWYVSSMQAQQQHMKLIEAGKPIIVHWAGSDILAMQEYSKDTDIQPMIDALNQDHVTCTAGREQVREEAMALGIKKVTICPVASRKEYSPMPLPIKQGETKANPIASDPLVTVYMPPLRTDFFNIDIILDVARALPNIPFILYSFSSPPDQSRLLPNVSVWGSLSEKILDQLIAQSSIHLRIVEHDGMSLSVIENCMAGRRVVCNQKYPGLPTVKKHVKSIVAAIKKINKESEPDLEISELYTKNFSAESQRQIISKILEESGLCLKV